MAVATKSSADSARVSSENLVGTHLSDAKKQKCIVQSASLATLDGSTAV
jgi:hypothetical protein